MGSCTCWLFLSASLFWNRGPPPVIAGASCRVYRACTWVRGLGSDVGGGGEAASGRTTDGLRKRSPRNRWFPSSGSERPLRIRVPVPRLDEGEPSRAGFEGITPWAPWVPGSIDLWFIWCSLGHKTQTYHQRGPEGTADLLLGPDSASEVRLRLRFPLHAGDARTSPPSRAVPFCVVSSVTPPSFWGEGAVRALLPLPRSSAHLRSQGS